MPRKHSKSSAIKNAPLKSDSSYISIDSEDGLNQYGTAIANLDIIQSNASYRYNHHQDYSNLANNVSGRPGLTRSDYEMFRPGESIPNNPKDSMFHSLMAYKRVGLVRNVMDLMSDFGCQGIRIVHPNKRIEKFFQNWWKRVRGPHTSERFLSYLYRLSNVVPRRLTGKLSKSARDNFYKTYAAADVDVEFFKPVSNEIPMGYIFYNPITVHIYGGALAQFSAKKKYGIKLPYSLRRLILSPRNDEEKMVANSLPKEVKEAAKNTKVIPLPSDKIEIYHYKKDDWEDWALPIIHSILEDIIVFQKLKLADIAALDGAISNIRIFKIGSLEHKIAPKEGAFAKLGEILENHTGVGTLDMVWGPDIELIESNTNVHQFLGEDKYKPTLQSIYAGLGIPPTLTGTFGATGTTNNFISLKTLTKRLQYGRQLLKEFWDKEIYIVQKAMGFRFPAEIEFEYIDLEDESAQKKLLLDMWDRNLISDEGLRYETRHNNTMERVRISRESRERNDGKIPEKSGPFYSSQYGIELKKTALQSGSLTPSQVGLSMDTKREHLKLEDKNSAVDIDPNQQSGDVGTKNSGTPGRPKNSKDTTKRKEKEFKPKLKAALNVWAGTAQEEISNALNPFLLNYFNKKNMRSLTAEEFETAEIIKFGVLSNLEPFVDLSDENIEKALKENGVPDNLQEAYNYWSSAITEELGRKLTIGEQRNIKSIMYTDYKLNGEQNV